VSRASIRFRAFHTFSTAQKCPYFLHCAVHTQQEDKPDKAAFGRALDDFYFTNPIARASAVMAECSVIAEGHAALTAAE
jgi:NADH dehydrogenase/NADH:ubiquinone oxidoreductase subunit G